MKRFFILGTLFTLTLAAPAAAGLVTCSGTECNFCDLAAMVNNIINWLFGFLVLAAVLLFVEAGFRLVTSGGNEDALKYAKNRLTYVVIGFLIMLVSWTVVDTVLQGLTGQGMSVWGSFDVESCGGQVEPQPTLPPEFVNPDMATMIVADGGGDTGYVAAGTTGVNCGVTPSSLVTIPGTSFVATAGTVQNFVAMRDAAARDGITLTVNSAYRSEQQQVDAWNNHNCNSADCSGYVARPCSLGGHGSNHNSGIALDLNTPSGSAAYNWMKAHGGQYGFFNNLPSDPWHWSPSGN